MDDREPQRKIRHRLAVLRHAEEVSGNVVATCRYYGISRTVFFKWCNRFDEPGAEGLRDRSSRPHHSPTATKGEVVERIVHLRQNCHFGPARVAMYLKRYHDVEVSSSGVWRVLHRLGLGRLPANQRYQRCAQRPKRYEKQRPGHRVQIDVKLRRPHRRRHDQAATASSPPSTTAPDCECCASTPKPTNAPRSRSSTTSPSGSRSRSRSSRPTFIVSGGSIVLSEFSWHVLDRGIGHVYIKPATPRLNGKVERSHRIDAQESSAGSSKASPSTTPTCSTTDSANGRTTATSNDPTAASTAKSPMKDSNRKPALRNQAGTSGSDWSDGLSLAWLAAGGEQYAEPVVVKVAEAAC